MSIRIHELAKRYNMEGKDLLAILKERGWVSADTKSVSSTLSKIYEEEVAKEFGSRVAAAAPEAEEQNSASASVVATAVETAESPKPRSPAGPFVKSHDDILRERESVAAAKAAASAAANPAPPVIAPAPAARPASAPIPPRPAPAPSGPVSRPPSLPPRPAFTPAPPAARPASAPNALPPTPVALRPVAAPAPVRAPEPAAAPAPLPAARPAEPQRAPEPVVAAPVEPPPSKSPSALPPTPGSGPRPLPARAVPSSPSPSPTSTVTISGDVKIIHFKPPVIVRDFATALNLRPFQLISELMQMGIFASITQSLEESVAAKVAEKHGFLLEVKHRGDVAAQQQAAKAKEKVKLSEDDTANLVSRPPIVVILGHVDHGKTSLLDAIRKADVAAGEAGGITQHIGAYQIEFNGRKITFLDTPGHAAFNKMRARGASVTDIAVLVVAADDGFMPQTDEALQHAQNAKVALIVAINKMDVKGANLEQVKAQMQQRSIAPEDWGGETITVPVSAVKGTGLNELLEMILLQSEVLELKANPKGEVTGVVIESQVDVGRGPVATIIVQRGTLKLGDALVCGPYWAKVRAMFDDKGANLKEAPPATPVRVVGWSGTPESGAIIKSVKNAREAESLAEEENQRQRQVVSAAGPKEVSVDQLFANIAATQHRVLKVIIKTDVFGSAEAIRHILEGIKTTKVQLEIVSTEVGLVTKNDVLMAGAAGSTVLGFNTKLENGVTPLAKHHGVRIETFGIIYELGDRVREMMADLLEPDLKEIKLGAAEVRAVFPLAKGFVAGCLVTEGKITRNATARLRRGRESVHLGKVDTLKRFKDDANEVRAGLECGIKLDDFNGYQVGDVIECFEIQKVRASL
jgi:translation initiation factor IF-2